MNLRKYTEAIEHFVVECMEERSFTRSSIIFRGGLFAISRVYRHIIQFRHWLYDKGICRRHPLGCLVVSIGNLTCGGTGKTPVVEVFARSLSQKGRKVAILSRGYKSKDDRTFLEKIKALYSSKQNEIPPRVVSDGERLLLNSSSAGDEPYMLASNVKDALVFVDKDRVKSGRYAISRYNVDTLILDDGFQYLDLKPHINIVLVDSTSPFHNHHTLPRGLLREPIKNIRRADYVFLTKSDGSNRLRHLKRFIEHHNRTAEIIECCHKPQYLEDAFNRGKQLPLNSLKNKKIATLCGIAKPAGFENFLSDQGTKILYKERFADHHAYSQQEMIDFINNAKDAGAAWIVTTEKDAVRMPQMNRRDIPIYFLRIEIDIISGHESFDQCISRICFR